VAAVAAAVGDADNPKISLSRFGDGEVALFMPCGKERVDRHGNPLYVAFNVNCPRHFLHPSSLRDFLTNDPVPTPAASREIDRDRDNDRDRDRAGDRSMQAERERSPALIESREPSREPSESQKRATAP